VALSPHHCGEVVAADVRRQQFKTLWRDCSAMMDHAAVSPDGRWVVAQRSCSLRVGGGEPPQILPRGCVDGDSRLQVVSLRGGAARSVGAERLRRPVWSPDSRAILAEGEDGRIVRVDLATGEQRTVAEGYHPAWSPDGRWIAYVRLEQSGERSVYTLRIARADGSGERVLFADRESWFSNMETRTNGSPRTPVWSPDGRRVVFVQAHHRGGTLWSVRSDGTGLRQLTRPLPRS
jgi:Tol biopolymer transport system component